MICCSRHCYCDYCPCCGRYLGSYRPWVYPHPQPYPWPWYYQRPWYPPVPYHKPFWDAQGAIQQGRAAVGAVG